MRKLGKVALVPVLASGLFAAAGTTAQAAPAGYPGWLNTNTEIYSGPGYEYWSNGRGFIHDEFYVSSTVCPLYQPCWVGGEDLNTFRYGWVPYADLAFS